MTLITNARKSSRAAAPNALRSTRSKAPSTSNPSSTSSPPTATPLVPYGAGHERPSRLRSLRPWSRGAGTRLREPRSARLEATDCTSDGIRGLCKTIGSLQIPFLESRPPRISSGRRTGACKAECAEKSPRRLCTHRGEVVAPSPKVSAAAQFPTPTRIKVASRRNSRVHKCWVLLFSPKAQPGARSAQDCGDHATFCQDEFLACLSRKSRRPTSRGDVRRLRGLPCGRAAARCRGRASV
jgi:hypothetical protein